MTRFLRYQPPVKAFIKDGGASYESGKTSGVHNDDAFVTSRAIAFGLSRCFTNGAFTTERN